MIDLYEVQKRNRKRGGGIGKNWDDHSVIVTWNLQKMDDGKRVYREYLRISIGPAVMEEKNLRPGDYVRIVYEPSRNGYSDGQLRIKRANDGFQFPRKQESRRSVLLVRYYPGDDMFRLKDPKGFEVHPHGEESDLVITLPSEHVEFPKLDDD